MFDTHHHNHRTESRTIHEHRAPTDESVKLLSEMERKMLERILARHSLQENAFNAEWVVITAPAGMGDCKVVCRFLLNGNEHTFEKDVCPLDARMNPQSLALQIRDELVKTLSEILTVQLFQDHKTVRNLISR
jgi:hypothetical protein